MPAPKSYQFDTLSVTASGSLDDTGALAGMLGAPIPVTLSGSMTINTANDSLSAGGRTFD